LYLCFLNISSYRICFFSHLTNFSQVHTFRRMIVICEFERIVKEIIWRYYFSIYLKRLRKRTKSPVSLEGPQTGNSIGTPGTGRKNYNHLSRTFIIRKSRLYNMASPYEALYSRNLGSPLLTQGGKSNNLTPAIYSKGMRKYLCCRKLKLADLCNKKSSIEKEWHR
jgi:hypothetical protein